MMIKNFMTVLVILLLSLFPEQVNSQSLTELEKNYINAKKNLENANHVLDSLKIVLNKKANQIDHEKSKQNADNDKIIEMMSSSVVVSNKYESQQKKVNQIENRITSIINELNKKYTSIIDSLQTLQNSDEFNGDKEQLDSQVLFYTEKKLAVAPKISLLSFDPSRLLKIDPGKTKDSLECTIYKEYLENAYAEISSDLKDVEQRYSEISRILLLQKKTERFLKETEFDNGIPTEGSTPDKKYATYTGSGRDVNPDPGVVEERAIVIDQYRGFTLLLNQLNIDPTSGDKLDRQLLQIGENSSLDLKQYKKVLVELRKKLQEYKLVLGNKIGNNK